jgi:hypothetical protein
MLILGKGLGILKEVRASLKRGKRVLRNVEKRTIL